jgi:dipeptidase
MSTPETFAGQVDDQGDGSGACTSIYFGKDTTVNGDVLYGRSEDYNQTWRKLMNVSESKTYEPGSIFETSTGTNFTWPMPEKTLRYIYCEDSYYNEGDAPHPYQEIGVNEKNVAITATVTLSSGKSAITGNSGKDPMVNSGLDEMDLTNLVLQEATTARAGVELLAAIIDDQGAAGREGTMISDPNETWFFESLSGHQYVGYKCPDGQLGLSPNITGNLGPNGVTDISDTENFVVSAGLITVAKDANTYVGDPADPENPNKIKIAASYANSAPTYTSGRMRMGYGYLFGYTTQDEINANVPAAGSYLNYFIDPCATCNKYDLYDAMQMLACRGIGTAWQVANPSSNSTSIGNNATQEAHVVQVRQDVPADLATIEWIAQGPAEFSIYLPYYGSLVTDVYDKYKGKGANLVDQQNWDPTDIRSNTFWHVAKRLYNLAKSPTTTEAARQQYGNGVKAFWEKYQKSLIAETPTVDEYLSLILKNEGRSAAEEAATDISMALAEQTYELYAVMIEELEAFTAAPSGNYVPSFINDESAMPEYASLVADGLKIQTALDKLYGMITGSQTAAQQKAIKAIIKGAKEELRNTDLADDQAVSAIINDARTAINMLISSPGTFVPSPGTSELAQDTKVISNIADAKLLTAIPKTTYTGKSVSPSIGILAYTNADTGKAEILKAGVDYVVSYSNNVNVGVATIVITGAGTYNGTKQLTFTISPKDAKVSKLTAAKGKKLTVKWAKAVDTAGKYQVRYKVKGAKKWTTKIVSGKSTSLTVKKLKVGKAYQVQVRAYKNVSGKTLYGAWSPVKTSAKIKK